MERPTHKRIGIKAAVGFAVACTLAIVGYDSLHDHSFRQRQFDSNAWKQGGVRVRGEMVESLRAQSLLRGKTRNEVIALLDKSDEDIEGQLRYRVDVGRRVAWRPFLPTLLVEFDDKFRVYRTQIVD